MKGFREWLIEQDLNESFNKDNLIKDLEKKLDKFQNEMNSKDPNTGYYRTYHELYENYSLLLKKAKKLNFSKKTYSGIDAIIMLNILPPGSKAKFPANFYPEAVYVCQHISNTQYFYGGDIWKSEDEKVRYSFAKGYEQISQSLNLKKGGLYQDDKNVKIKILQIGDK